jgi:hypothetical protein
MYRSPRLQGYRVTGLKGYRIIVDKAQRFKLKAQRFKACLPLAGFKSSGAEWLRKKADFRSFRNLSFP